MKRNLLKKGLLPLALVLLSTSIACATQNVKEEAPTEKEESTSSIYPEKEGLSFTDISGNWAEKEIEWSYAKGISKGISEGKFEPDGELTRGMFVTMLYRMEGSSDITGENKFKDISEEDYYYDAVRWATENGIVKGISENEFAPNESISREDAVTILYRKKGNNEEIDPKTMQAYIDKNEISDYAEKAVSWSVKNGVMKGYNPNEMKPKKKITRAQTVAVLMRYSDLDRNVEKEYFNTDVNNVYQIIVTNGSTGSRAYIKDPENIKSIVNKFNSFEASKVDDWEPVSGYFYSVKIELKDTNKTIDYSPHENGIVAKRKEYIKEYITEKEGYTINDWHELFSEVN